MKYFVALLLMLLPWQSFAAATRTSDADVVTSSDKSKTYTMPTATGTLINSGTLLQEIPSGTVNGSTTVFTLANTPLSNSVVKVYQDGVLMEQGAGKDYTLSGSTITMLTAPALGQSLLVVYSK